MHRISITDKQIEVPKTGLFQQPVWQLAFRSGFLLGTFTSVVTLILWVGLLNGWWQLSVTGLSPVIWHLHEMLFGFATMIAVGFVLTAVQTWTGLQSLHGKPLALLVMLWMLARIGFWLNTPVWLAVAVAAQMIWWLLSVATLSQLLIASQNKRNYVLIVMFGAMAILNLAVMLADIFGDSALALHLGRSMVLLFTLLMSVIGGRVIPFFTWRGAGLAKLSHPASLDLALLVATIIAVSIFIAGHFVNLPVLPAPFIIAAGILHLCRLCYWQSAKTLLIPLLWSLHLSYLLLGAGLVLLGLSYFTQLISFSSALHLITIGAMGLMILSMMSRVSLGHTGRPLTPHPLLSVVFAVIVIAAFARSVLPAFGLHLLAWNISAMFWILAALLFLWIYMPMLLSARK